MDGLKSLSIPGLEEARSAKPRKLTVAQFASWVFFILTTTFLAGTWLEYSPQTVNYVTLIGEHRSVELADNSHIDLNTDTRVSVRISLLHRDVVLTQGEALF